MNCENGSAAFNTAGSASSQLCFILSSASPGWIGVRPWGGAASNHKLNGGGHGGRAWYRNADVALASGVVKGAVGIDKGKIVAIARDEALPPSKEVIDAQGHLLIPGLVDPHSHPGGKYPIDEDFKTETPGAAAGGVTTMGCIVRVPRMGQPFKEFPVPADVISWADAFPLGKEICEKNSLVDFFYTFTMNSLQHVEEIPRYAEELGVTSFKFHGNLKALGTNPVSPRWAARIGLPNSFDDSLFYVGFESIGKLKGSSARALVHCENVEVAPIFQERLQRAGIQGLEAWSRRSPLPRG